MINNLLRLFATKFSIWAVIIYLLLSFPTIKQSKYDDSKNYFAQHALKGLAIENAIARDINSLPKWPHEKSDLLPDPALLFGRLDNGFRYVLMNNHEPKDRVSMHLNIQTGSMNESDQQQGLAHFLEHMLYCGSKHFKPGELVKYFQSIGIQFGPDANAHTGFNETVYDILLPLGNKESLEKGLLVMRDFADGALLLQSEIDRERRVVLAEKRTRDSASYRTYVSSLRFEFPEARISKRLPIGTEDVLKNAQRNLLKDFYDTWYRPENMILIMVGDFDVNPARLLIEERFSSLSTRAPPNPHYDIGKIKHKGIKSFYHFEKEIGNTTVSIEVIRKAMQGPDSLAFQTSQLKKDIADRIVRNRLDKTVRNPDTPFTSSSISSGIYLKQIEYANITAESRANNWGKTLAILEQTLRSTIEYGFTEQELKRVKKDYLAHLDNAVKKASTRDSQALAREIIRNLNSNRVFQSPDQEKELYAPIIKSLSLEAVHDSFRETWENDHRLILVTGNAKLTDMDTDPQDMILAVYDKSSRKAVSKPIEIKPATFPYLSEPERKGLILSKKRITDLGIVQIDFENGIRLNLKKTDFAANEVLVNIVFGVGRSSEPSNSPGLSILSEKVINESGFGSLKRDEIEQAMAGKNTTVVFDVEEGRFIFKGKTVPKEIPLLFQLLYAHLVDPGYEEDAYKLTMERFSQQYTALSRSIDGAMMLFGKRFLAGGDSRFGLPPYDEFKKLTFDHIRKWIHNRLTNAIFEVSVVGDFDEDSVIETASVYLGSLAKRPGVQEKKRSRLIKFPIHRSLNINVDTEIPKSLVIVAYPTEDFWNIKRTRRFSVLAEIFSDRLRERVREKLGVAYSPFAYNKSSRTYPGYGALRTMVHVDPNEADMVIREIKKIGSDLASDGVTEEELRRALDPILTSIKDMRRTNNYWLNSVLTESKKYPRQFDWSRSIMRDYTSIAADELSTLAKKYLNNNKAATIVIKPAH